MNKPKTKEEALAQLEELKAYIDTMPDDVERDLTDIERGDYFFLPDNNVIASVFNSDTTKNSNDDAFPQRLRTRSIEHLESMKKYRDATSRFMAKCHEVNIGDDGEKNCEVYLRSGIWLFSYYDANEIKYPLSILVSVGGANKLIEWCEREYPNGLDWSEL